MKKNMCKLDEIFPEEKIFETTTWFMIGINKLGG